MGEFLSSYFSANVMSRVFYTLTNLNTFSSNFIEVIPKFFFFYLSVCVKGLASSQKLPVKPDYII